MSFFTPKIGKSKQKGLHFFGPPLGGQIKFVLHRSKSTFLALSNGKIVVPWFYTDIFYNHVFCSLNESYQTRISYEKKLNESKREVEKCQRVLNDLGRSEQLVNKEIRKNMGQGSDENFLETEKANCILKRDEKLEQMEQLKEEDKRYFWSCFLKSYQNRDFENILL